MEEGFPIIKHLNFNGYKLKVYIFAFRYDLDEEKSLADRRRMNNEGVIFVLGVNIMQILKLVFLQEKQLIFQESKMI